MRYILPRIFLFVAAITCINATPLKKYDSLNQSFPEEWTGHWSGILNIHSTKGNNQSVPMSLQISPIEKDRWSWIITYGEGEKADIRKYELLATDPEKGIYMLDEKNSIMIDFYLEDNTFHSLFSVQQNLLESAYELRDEKIYFSIVVYDLAQPTQTGGENDIPLVTAHKVKSVQKAVLEKAK